MAPGENPARSSSTCALRRTGPNLSLAVPDHCASFTDYTVFDGEKKYGENDVQFGDIFTDLAIDGAGNLYSIGIGYVNSAAFAPVLMAGIVALNGFLGGLQKTTMPLIMDFSFTREIEDRLLAPMPIPLVAVEKMVFGALRGIIAAVLMVPIGLLILSNVNWPLSKLPAAFGVICLGALAGAAIGMTIGTLVTPRRINIMFAVVLTVATLGFAADRAYGVLMRRALQWRE